MNKTEKVSDIRISVIVPIYNAMPFLMKCLDTICGQTLHDIEIIAIDDCSSDESYTTLLQYAERDRRIIPLKNPYNIGAARTRNIGIQLARGEYLAILDADDFYELDFLEVMYGKAKCCDCDLSICDVALYDQNTGKEKIRPVAYFLFHRFGITFSSDDIFDYIFNLFLEIPHNKIYRRLFILEKQLMFQDLANSNDVYFCNMAVVLADRMTYVRRALVHYRQNWGGNIQAVRGNNPLCVYYAAKKIFDSIVTSGFWEKCKSSYYRYVMAIIMNSLRYSPLKTTEDIISFWRYEGFKKIRMDNLTKSDFKVGYKYQEWCSICREGKKILPEEISNRDEIADFIHNLSTRNYSVAIWGYGNFGHLFKQVADVCGFSLVEAYDNNEIKWGRSEEFRVCNFEQRSEKVDTVVITVMNEYEKIATYIHQQEHCLRIIALEPFLIYGATIEECELS